MPIRRGTTTCAPPPPPAPHAPPPRRSTPRPTPTADPTHSTEPDPTDVDQYTHKTAPRQRRQWSTSILGPPQTRSPRNRESPAGHTRTHIGQRQLNLVTQSNGPLRS